MTALDSYGKVIAVVEDDEDMRGLIRKYLERAGFETCCAGTGEEGVEMMKKVRPALIFLDVNLPDMTGWDVLCAARDCSGLEQLPAVIGSGSLDEKARYSEEKPPNTTFVQKPFTKEELISAVKRMLGPAGSP